jgi:hypothetical protein
MATMRDRLNRLDWSRIEASLWGRGYAKTPPLLTPEECRSLIDLYKEDARFRSRIEMARHRFGEGEYKYFTYPLPEPVQELRVHAYPRLVAVANRWADALRQGNRYPRSLTAFLNFCHDHGQTKPTPLLLRYGPGGYNCLHQDLYGDIAFPFQLTVFLSSSDDYIGGQFLLLEQRPRAQSRGEAISTERGEAVIFTTRYRPVSGKRGYFKVTMRHGVSTVHAGSRFTLGIIFHDAR